jgi:hypothetical protein
MRLSRGIVTLVVLVGCDRRPTPIEVVEHGWQAHARLVAAGEHAATCAAAGAAMQAVFERERPAFVAALALERDKARLEAVRGYLEAHDPEYRDLETRTDALSERCADDAAVGAVFAKLELPDGN